MKKLMLALALVLGFSLSHAVEVKFSSLSWIDYEAPLANTGTNFQMADTDGFWTLGRLYNTFKVKLSDNVKARVTVDLSKPESPWKYAYADWKIISPLVLTFGLQKTWYGYTPLWDYKLPVKALADRVSSSSSADIGIGVGGSIADDLLKYNFQVVNGEGYGKLWNMLGFSREESSYAFIANMVVTPIDALSVGVSFRKAEVATDGLPAATDPDNSLSAYVDFMTDKIWVLGEVDVVLPEGADSLLHFQITVGLTLSDQIGIYANFFNEAQTSTNATQTVTVGAGLSPAKGFTLKPYVGLDLDSTAADTLTQITLGFQTEIKFGFTVAE